MPSRFFPRDRPLRLGPLAVFAPMIVVTSFAAARHDTRRSSGQRDRRTVRLRSNSVDSTTASSISPGSLSSS